MAEMALRRWCEGQLPSALDDWQALAGDASTRRYFRLRAGEDSWIASMVDPATPDNRAFVDIQKHLFDFGIRVPYLHRADLQQGFVLQEDLGGQHLQDLVQQLGPSEALAQHYQRLISILVRMQRLEPGPLPSYDQAFLRRELELFPEWFLTKALGLQLEPADLQLLAELFERLEQSALQQPQVFVHRDYHCRNLMWDGDQWVMIDFQGALLGPITYDLVSLLKDCYVAWPTPWIQQRLHHYHQLASGVGLLEQVSFADFERQFHWMGLQRHLKVLGIFARLALRDDKPGYLTDLPRVVAYVEQVLLADPELKPWAQWWQERVLPQWQLSPWYQTFALPTEGAWA